MANKAGKKLIKNVAKVIAKKTVSDNSFSLNDINGAFKTGVSMGVSKRAMGKAINKGVKQGAKSLSKKGQK